VSGQTQMHESGQLLLEWLSLLGWQTSVRRNGTFEGVASHVAGDNRRLEVTAKGESLEHVALQLFERALGALSR
jgi:hypothetical protein